MRTWARCRESDPKHCRGIRCHITESTAVQNEPENKRESSAVTDIEQNRHISDGATLHGKRLLISLPPSKKDRTRVIAAFLADAKHRWGMEVDAICAKLDQKGFAPLVGPNGRYFIVPHLLRPQDWESDTEEVAEVERKIHEAELASGLPMGRLVLAAAHSVGRAFSTPVRRVRRYALVRKVLKDNAQPFLILRRLFHFADQVLEEATPDFICTYEYATALNGVLWFAAKRRGISCVGIRFSKINSGEGFWTLDRKLLNTIAIKRGTARRLAGATPSGTAKARIDKFRNRPATVAYITNKWRGHAERGFLRWHAQYLRTMARETLSWLRGQDRALAEPLGSRLGRYYLQLLMGQRHQRLLHSFDEDDLAATKYVYFPMHKEGELAQTLQATQWYDQRNTIRVLASLLPFGYRLLAREHRLNFGHRPTRFYRELAQIPNVVVIDPFNSQFKYLRHADLVVTENGSSGWEGLMLGRRVLVLSNTFYDGAGLGVRVTDPDRLNKAILEIIAKRVTDDAAYDQVLASSIDAELETTFPMEEDGANAAVEMLAEVVGTPLKVRERS